MMKVVTKIVLPMLLLLLGVQSSAFAKNTIDQTQVEHYLLQVKADNLNNEIATAKRIKKPLCPKCRLDK